MNQAVQAERARVVHQFRNKLLDGELTTAEELAAYDDLQAMAAFLADSHAQLRTSLGLVDLAQASGKYVRLSTKQEFGLTLYWASNWGANPPSWFAKWISEHPVYADAFDVLKYVLKKFEHDEMSKADYDTLMLSVNAPGLVGDDGTIFGFGKYEQLDERWMIAALNYLINLVHPDDIHPFPNNPIQVATMSPVPNPTRLHPNPEPVLGIIGDWGGGSYTEKGVGVTPVESPAKRVLDNVKQQNLDYLFHLGDTYYAGTDESRLGPDDALEEQENLVDLWPNQGPGRNYTLNSNHEMYGAAQGYFKTALLNSGLFDTQNNASLFALKYPLSQSGQAWLVLGLDSAYFSDKENGIKMYMEGAIGSKKFLDRHQWQMQEIARLCKNHVGPIMVMTHHNPCDTISFHTNILYDQVVEAIGRAPTLWLWGHVHQCIVYDRMLIHPNHPNGPVRKSPTKGRCCGHAAVPYGPAWGLENSLLPYVAGTHDDAFPAGNPRVYNGFGRVTLHNDGGFTESYYEVRLPGQSAHEAWSRRWAASELDEESAEA